MVNCKYKTISLNNRGVALYITYMVLLVASLLAAGVLRFIASSTRLTQHKAGRIQSYYLAQAVTNWTLEQLRTGALLPGQGAINPIPPQFPIPPQRPGVVSINIGNLGAGTPDPNTSAVNVVIRY